MPSGSMEKGAEARARAQECVLFLPRTPDPMLQESRILRTGEGAG